MASLGASSMGPSDCNIDSMLGGVPSGQTESLPVWRFPWVGSLRATVEDGRLQDMEIGIY